MSQPEGGPSRRRRQYVARACNSCRRRRCKCDGTQPACGPCMTSCTWGTDGEDSGRPATKQFVESLRVKVQQLESEIAQLKREPLQTQSPLGTPTHPSNSLSNHSPGSIELLRNITDTPPATDFKQALPEVYPESYALPEPHHPIQTTHFAPTEVSVVSLPPFVPSVRYQYIFNIETTLPLDEQYPSHRASLICQWNRYFPDLSPVQLSSPEIRARETRAKFAAHAKQWLDQEFDRPSPSLIVSLVLLSEYHSGIGERNVGHMYMGMAELNQLTFLPEIGTIGPHLFKASKTSLEECLMALEINKSSEMSVPQVPISCPIAIEFDSRPPLADSPTELLNHPDYLKYSALCFIQMCKLMVIAAQMIDHPSNEGIHRQNDTRDMPDIHLQLEAWFNNLPEGVLIRQRATLTFPPVLALHITYWWFILYSHVSVAEQISLSTPEPVRDLSIKMCARATEKLVQLFNTFDKQFGLRNFPRNLIKSIYTCGSALVIERDSASSASRKKRATATEGIDACISTLKSVGDRWPVAIRMSQELETLAGVNPSPLSS
ncbi:hypothetical protein B0J17DRAFT_710755 [Rhizoctonia solani]|nr:hypothetical protein B0J17DRAFT_710755 [Rhizoctonia solani]